MSEWGKDWDGKTERRQAQPEQKGFVVRYELLGIISLMVIQLLGASWWASSMATDVKYMRQDITKLSLQLESAAGDRYSGADAARDQAAIDARFNRYEVRLAALENRIGK